MKYLISEHWPDLVKGYIQNQNFEAIIELYEDAVNAAQPNKLAELEKIILMAAVNTGQLQIFNHLTAYPFNFSVYDPTMIENQDAKETQAKDFAEYLIVINAFKSLTILQEKYQSFEPITVKIIEKLLAEYPNAMQAAKFIISQFDYSESKDDTILVKILNSNATPSNTIANLLFKAILDNNKEILKVLLQEQHKTFLVESLIDAFPVTMQFKMIEAILGMPDYSTQQQLIDILLDADKHHKPGNFTYKQMLFKSANARKSPVIFYLCQATNTWNKSNAINFLSHLIAKKDMKSFKEYASAPFMKAAFAEIKKSKSFSVRNLREFEAMFSQIEPQKSDHEVYTKSSQEKDYTVTGSQTDNRDPIYNTAAAATLVDSVAFHAPEKVRTMVDVFKVDPYGYTVAAQLGHGQMIAQHDDHSFYVAMHIPNDNMDNLENLLNMGCRAFRTDFRNYDPEVPRWGWYDKVEINSIEDIGNMGQGNMTVDEFMEVLNKWKIAHPEEIIYISDFTTEDKTFITPDGESFSIRDYFEHKGVDYLKFNEIKTDSFENLRPDDYRFLTSEEIEIIRSQPDMYNFPPEGLYVEHDFDINKLLKYKVEHSDPTVEVISGLFGVVGAYQIAYSLAANNSIFRNTYSRYVDAVKNLEEFELQQIYQQYNTHEEQVAAIKDLVKKKECNSMFNNTVEAGVAGTLVFSLILSFFVGPFALIAAGAGFLVSYFTARYNSRLLEAKINDILQMPVMTTLINDKVLSFPDGIRPINKANLTESRIQRMLSAVSLSTIGLRVASIAQFGLSAFAPPLFAAFAAVKSAVSWRNARNNLKQIFTSPARTLYSGLTTYTEGTSLTSNKYSRNIFKTFLLDNMAKVQQIIQDHNLKTNTKDSRLTAIARKILAPLGIWENAEFNNILNILYEPTPEAHAQLEKLRQECNSINVYHNMTKNWKQLSKKLKVEPNDIEILAKDDSPLYRTAIISYLKQAAVDKAKKIVMQTGLSTTVAAAIIVISLAFFFSPLGPLSFAVGAGILVVGYAASKIAASYQGSKMQKLVDKVPDDAMTDVIERCKTTLESAQNSLEQNLTVKTQQEQHVQPVAVAEPSNEPQKQFTERQKRKMTFGYIGEPETPNPDIKGSEPKASSKPDLGQ